MVSNISSRLKSTLHLNSVNLDNSLPNEIWRIIFSYLKARQLCRCQCVCKDWKTIILSIDSTRWKELYLKQNMSKRWKHPHWPNYSEKSPEIESWQRLYKIRVTESRQWVLCNTVLSCSSTFFFKRKRERKTLHVGFSQQYKTLKSAVDAASSYDTILLYPGTYQQPSVLCIKYSLAIVGVDAPENIIIMTQIQVQSDSVKFENVTLKPMYPRLRTAHGRRATFIPLVKISCGHLYMYNCHVDTGYVHIISPAIASIASCLFTENSFLKFSGVWYSRVTNCEFHPDKVALFIDETFQIGFKPASLPSYIGGWVAAANEKAFETFYTQNILNKIDRTKRNCESFTHKHKKSFSSQYTDSDDSDTNINTSKMKLLNDNKSISKSLNKVEDEEVLANDVKQMIRLIQGVIVKNAKICNGHGGIMICRLGQVWVEDSVFCNLSYGVRCLQNSKCVLINNEIYNLESTGIFVKDHGLAFIAGNKIYCNGEAGIDIRSSADPLIQHNIIYGGKRSGIVCLDDGKGVIRENEIYDNKEAGIYILRKGSPKVKNNRIWSGQAAGIAVTEDGRGHITNNTIIDMDWAGIDIRYGGNPVISHNTILNGKSDGIVVGAGGKSIIFDNEIRGNSGCGIWVLDGSHPLIHSNRISHSGRSGIAFLRDSDQEHETQELNNQFSSVQNRHSQFQQELLQDDGSVDGEEEFDFALIIPDIEPESRFVHVSKPEKQYPQVESNVITFNKDHGILYNATEGVVIARNQIINNTKDGITLTHPSEITVQDNNIKFNKSGINVELGVCCTIQGNGIFNNAEYGITTAGSGSVRSNDIFGHTLSGIFMRSNADIYIGYNRLHVLNKECVHLEAKSRCLFEENKIYISENTVETIHVSPLSDVTYEKKNVEEVIEDTSHILDCESTNEFPRNPLSDILSILDEVKPISKDGNVTTAPFYTAVQPVRNHRQSSFCNII